MHFRNCSRFFRLLEIAGRTEQGAGELGPLGSAGRTDGLPTRQTNLIERSLMLRAFVKCLFTRFLNAVVARILSKLRTTFDVGSLPNRLQFPEFLKGNLWCRLSGTI